MDILKKHYALFTGLLVFIVYLFTLAPSIIQIDAGELAAVQSLPGIAHPTGYPLFTILGFLFLKIPSPFSQILMANLLAALWCSAGAAVFTLTARYVLENRRLFHKDKPEQKKIKTDKKHKKHHTATVNAGSIKTSSDRKAAEGAPGTEKSSQRELREIIASAAGGLVLAFSKTFWFQSTSVEVYSLHILLMCLIIFSLVKAYSAPQEKPLGDLKQWLLFAFILALGFSNHMTTLLILPAAAYLYFIKNRFNKDSFKKIALMLLLFFPVLLLIYSYLPLRASQNPPVNWGNPVDMERIMRHVSGQQYRVWLFSSMDSAKKQLGYFLTNLPSEYAIVGLVFCLFGIFVTYRISSRFFIFTVIAFFTTVLYSINYDIHDIDSYFILAYISLAFLAVFGIYKLTGILHYDGRPYLISFIAVTVFILVQLYFNSGKVSQSGIYTFEDYTKAVIGSTGKNSLIISYQWDYFISGSYYFQKVEGFRKDAAVVDKELLRRSWYYNQLKTNHPDVVGRMGNEINMFLDALKPFEREENFNPTVLENLYRTIMQKLITDNIDKRPVYIAPELVENEMARGEFALPPGYTLVPDLFLFKVVRSENYVPAPNPSFILRIPEKKNDYIRFIQDITGRMLIRRAMYEMKFDKTERARKYINKIKSDLPDYQMPDQLPDALK